MKCPKLAVHELGSDRCRPRSAYRPAASTAQGLLSKTCRPGMFTGHIGSLVVAQVLLEGRPVGRLDGVDLHVQAW